MKTKHLYLLALGLAPVLAFASIDLSQAQNAAATAYKRLTGPQTLNPGEWPQSWPYPDEYDSAVAASEVHHIRYIDPHVRFVEVAYFEGVHGQMHGHPWPSVFAVDAPAPPNSVNVLLDPARTPDVGRWPGNVAEEFPNCQTMGPQSPHAETNHDTWPHHFYRLEFLRVDGDGIQSHWREWYAPLTWPQAKTAAAKPAANAPKLSTSWPYPAEMDSWRAAPGTNKLLYEDDHVRLIEVTLRPGETEQMHGDPYPSVLASDAATGEAAPEDRLADRSAALNAPAKPGVSPKGFPTIACSVSAPRAPHALHNGGKVPVHFYRIEFKRVDGKDLATRWRQWYPWMAKIADEYVQHPYVMNY